MSEAKCPHCQLPWFVDHHNEPIADTGDYNCVALIRSKGESHPFPSWIAEIADCEKQEANAEFIVRACNSHYDLLEACNRTKEILDAWGPERRGHTLELLHARLTAAIAKATNAASQE